jgi:hypothetical protein
LDQHITYQSQYSMYYHIHFGSSMFAALLQGFHGADPPFEAAPHAIVAVAPDAIVPAVPAGAGRGRQVGHLVSQESRSKMKLAWAQRKLSRTAQKNLESTAALHPSRSEEAVHSAFDPQTESRTRNTIINGIKITDQSAAHRNQFDSSKQRGIGRFFLLLGDCLFFLTRTQAPSPLPP